MKFLRLIFLILFLLITVSCAARDDKKLTQEETPEKLYNEGVIAIKNHQYKKASEKFSQIEIEYPYFNLAEKSEMLLAYTYYLDQEYELAVDVIGNFVNLYPASGYNEYLYYLKSICYFEQINNVKNDQINTQKALDSLNEVIARYPNSIYSRDAKIKIDLVYEHLAGKEMEIGRYYLKNFQYIAAINRFKNVVEKYQTSNNVPEALYRLSICYNALNLYDQSLIYASTLGYNYVNSKWYNKAYNLIKQYDKTTDNK